MNTTGDNTNKPNIVYIVLDDMGFSDLGCYGSEIKTPCIDKLADNGLRYNNFNVTPLCSPTRACLLTGRNHHSVGMGSIANFDLGPDFPNIRGRISSKAATLGEILNDHDYNSYAVGKWHLAPSKEYTPAGPFHNWPLQKGFHRFYGFFEGSTNQYHPELIYDNHMIDPPGKLDYHFSEDMTEQAVQFVTDHVSAAPEKPFFLYMAFGAQHAPHQVPRSYIDKYKHVYDKGWDEIRKERFQRQKQTGIIPENTEISPLNEGVKAWESLSEDEKFVFARFMETYAGFLTHTDEQIGRFLDFLEYVGALDNTMVVLLSDNGASQEGWFNGTVNHSTYYNGVQESIDYLMSRMDDIGGPESFSNYPLGWAQACNTPFKYYKQNTHFGGVRVPLIIQYPVSIKNGGAICKQFHHAIDIMPTVMDVLNIQAPKTYKGIEQIDIHGKSMKYTFNGKNLPSARNTQYFLMNGNRGIWHDGWVAVTRHQAGVPFEKDEWELYHADEDFSQVYNLAEDHPEKLQHLQQLWWTEAEAYGALPLMETNVKMFNRNAGTRTRFTYYPGMAHLGIAASPPIINKSFTISVPIERTSLEEAGVLVAAGNVNSGYSFYIKENMLYFDYNYLGTIYKVQSNSPVPDGDCTLRFDFNKLTASGGKGSLYFNNEFAGEGIILQTLPRRISHEGFDIGRDSLSPVSPDYPEKDFPFTGKIQKVEFILKDI